MAKISDTELQSIINGEITNALGFLGGNLSSQRKKSVEYYLGEKLGTEIDGRSQVVSTDVADTIETILPNLLRIFTASDQVVRCEPVKAEDVALAEQATNYINYVFNKDNPGFSILYTWFKDALLEKNGIVKVFWDESQKVEQETYRNLNENEYQLLVDDENIEFVESEEFIDETGKELLAEAEAQGQDVSQIPVPKLYNCIIKRTNKTGKVNNIVAIELFEEGGINIAKERYPNNKVLLKKIYNRKPINITTNLYYINADFTKLLYTKNNKLNKNFIQNTSDEYSNNFWRTEHFSNIELKAHQAYFKTKYDLLLCVNFFRNFYFCHLLRCWSGKCRTPPKG